MNNDQSLFLKESPTAYNATVADDVDVALLRENLKKTPWERMQANDDAMNFAESLRTAMEKRNAKFS